MVTVKSRSDSAIGTLQQLGLPATPIQVTHGIEVRDINLDAFGGVIPPEVQIMLGAPIIDINLINVDPVILNECLRLSQGYPPAIGQLARAGTRLGGGVARFVPPNCFIGLNISAPVNGIPYRFLTAHLIAPPVSFSLGTEKSIFNTRWRALPYCVDPWNNGAGALGQVIWDNGAD
jgi:hypothetical protein